MKFLLAMVYLSDLAVFFLSFDGKKQVAGEDTSHGGRRKFASEKYMMLVK